MLYSRDVIRWLRRRFTVQYVDVPTTGGCWSIPWQTVWKTSDPWNATPSRLLLRPAGFKVRFAWGRWVCCSLRGHFPCSAEPMSETTMHQGLGVSPPSDSPPSDSSPETHCLDVGIIVFVHHMHSPICNFTTYFKWTHKRSNQHYMLSAHHIIFPIWFSVCWYWEP